MIPQARLAALRALVDAAQPGPWFVAEEIDGVRAGRRTVVKAKSPEEPTGPPYLTTRRIVTVDQTRPHWDDTAEENVALIAAARTAIPELLDEIDRLTSSLALARSVDG